MIYLGCLVVRFLLVCRIFINLTLIIYFFHHDVVYLIDFVLALQDRLDGPLVALLENVLAAFSDTLILVILAVADARSYVCQVHLVVILVVGVVQGSWRGALVIICIFLSIWIKIALDELAVVVNARHVRILYVSVHDFLQHVLAFILVALVRRHVELVEPAVLKRARII